MSRVVNTDSPGKRRNQHMRSCAELLRHLSQKSSMDAEARDMLAALIFVLNEIEDGLEESAAAWEKRDYWIKAEQFRQRWSWVGLHRDELRSLMQEEAWNDIPTQIVSLLPHFADIKVVKFTRTSALWDGMYEKLLQEQGAQ